MQSKLIFLGSGSAFTMNNRQSNMVLQHSYSNLLIDCGTDIRHSLKQSFLSYSDIDAVYISHLHADHIGGLEYLALMTYFTDCSKPELFINEHLKHKLWNSLSSGLSTLQGKPATLDTYFKNRKISEPGIFIWHNLKFQTVQTTHVRNEFTIMPSFGLIFELNGKKIFITTDTQFYPEHLNDIYKDVDLIFQDCETVPTKSGVHAHYEQLVTLDEDVKNKMWLYHYGDGELPNAGADGFRGFAKKGHIFT